LLMACCRQAGCWGVSGYSHGYVKGQKVYRYTNMADEHQEGTPAQGIYDQSDYAHERVFVWKREIHYHQLL